MRRGWIGVSVGLLVAVAAIAQEHPARLQIALLELEVTGGLDTTLGRPLSDRFRQELFKTGVFTVVERNVMEEVLVEQSIQLAGCTSNECAVEAGRVLGVEQMVVGSVSRVGDILTVNARMIDVETTELTVAESIDCSCSLEEVLTSQLQKLAKNIAEAVHPEFEDEPDDDRAEQSERQFKDFGDMTISDVTGELHKFGSAGARWLERLNLSAVGTKFGWSYAPYGDFSYYGSFGNGVFLEFPPKLTGGKFRSTVELIGGGADPALSEANFYSGGVRVSRYRFFSRRRPAFGYYYGGGASMLVASRDDSAGVVVKPSLGLDVFIGRQIDLKLDVGGRKLCTFIEVRLESQSFEPLDLLAVTIQTGLTWRLKTFD